MNATRALPFCTDEDIAARFRADFVTLCGPEYLARGSDGVFLPASPWTLTSALSAMEAQGVAPGNVFNLTAPPAAFGSAGSLYAVDAVTGSSVALRRLNLSAGQGMPPGPVAGLVGVAFAAPTLRAQIENASYDLDRRYGIDSLITGRRQSDMFDPREVRAACVLTVAADRYFDLARQGDNDLFYKKAAAATQQLRDLLDRVSVHWLPGPIVSGETTRFNTRIGR